MFFGSSRDSVCFSVEHIIFWISEDGHRPGKSSAACLYATINTGDASKHCLLFRLPRNPTGPLPPRLWVTEWRLLSTVNTQRSLHLSETFQTPCKTYFSRLSLDGTNFTSAWSVEGNKEGRAVGRRRGMNELETTARGLWSYLANAEGFYPSKLGILEMGQKKRFWVGSEIPKPKKCFYLSGKRNIWEGSWKFFDLQKNHS